MLKPSMLVVVFLLAGCSNKANYENLQRYKQSSCKKLPQPQYAECIENVTVKTSYKEYERERNK